MKQREGLTLLQLLLLMAAIALISGVYFRYLKRLSPARNHDGQECQAIKRILHTSCMLYMAEKGIDVLGLPKHQQRDILQQMVNIGILKPLPGNPGQGPGTFDQFRIEPDGISCVVHDAQQRSVEPRQRPYRSSPRPSAATKNPSPGFTGAQSNLKRGMILIPAGWFMMGPNPYEASELKPRRVYLDAYYIDKFEITNKEYALFVKWTGAKEPPHWSDPELNQPDQPALVSWEEANSYCRWAGKRLPTEAEWEKAARGTDGRKYPWGNREPDGWYRAENYGTSGKKLVVPGGRFPESQSPYGVHDMADNAQEWCADWFLSEYHCTSPEKNPTGPTVGCYRVLRGAPHPEPYGQANLGCATRFSFDPKGGAQGFRAVWSTHTSPEYPPVPQRSVQFYTVSSGEVLRAEILVDGQATGHFTPDNIAIPTGTHTIMVQKKGYKSWSTSVHIDLGGWSFLKVTLDRMP